MPETPKTPFRLPEYTRKQLAELGQLLNLNMTEVVKIAIDRMYREESGKRKLTVDRLDKKKVYTNLSVIHTLDRSPVRLHRVYWNGESWYAEGADDDPRSSFELWEGDELLTTES